MENFRPQNIEPKKDDTSKQGKSFAEGLRNVVVAGLATLAMSPQKGEAQTPKNKEIAPKVYTDKKEYNKAKNKYEDSLNSYNKSKEAEKIYKWATDENLSYETFLINLSKMFKSDFIGRYKKDREFNQKANKLSWDDPRRKALIKEWQKLSDEDNKELQKVNRYLSFKTQNNRQELNENYDVSLYTKRGVKPIKLIGDPRKNDLLSGEAMYSAYPVFKKPVQKVEYKPETEENTEEELLGAIEEGKEFFKYYDNKAEYEKALQEYTDSLVLYTDSENKLKELLEKKKDEIEKVVVYKEINPNLKDAKIKPIGHRTIFVKDKTKPNWHSDIYKKPLAIPKLRENKSLGSINVHGRKIEYTSEEQKNEILQKLKEHNISASKVGDSENYTVTRFQEKTKGWQGNKLLDETGAVLINLDK